MKAKITGKNGNGVGSDIFFEAESDTEITENMAMQAQYELGYHPAGYGFYRFNSIKTENGFYAKWICSASCD